MKSKEIIRVAVLGPQESYSSEAARIAFPKAEYLLTRSFQKVFDSVRKGEADYGVVPVENSTDGSVTSTLDLLAEEDVKILLEVDRDISHFLLAQGSSGKIAQISSKPEALAQCRKWIEKNYPNAELVDAPSTSQAAEWAAEEGNEAMAAIGSEAAAKKYGLAVLARGIQDVKHNRTRFAVIGKRNAKPIKTPGKKTEYKTSLIVSLRHKPGSLFDALSHLKNHKINMTRIESRPSRKAAWEYLFFIDFEGKTDEKRVIDALREMKKSLTFIKVLGSYPVKR